MEEDDPISKRSIFQFLLGRDTWQDLYKDFLKLQRDFFQAMDYRAWVTPEQCVEVCRGSARGVGRQGLAQGRARMGSSSWTHLISLSDPEPEPTPLGLEPGAPGHPLASRAWEPSAGSWSMGLCLNQVSGGPSQGLHMHGLALSSGSLNQYSGLCRHERKHRSTAEIQKVSLNSPARLRCRTTESMTQDLIHTPSFCCVVFYL